MKSVDPNLKYILLDCDVLSHFCINNKLNDLIEILDPYIPLILEQVYDEISHNQLRKSMVDSCIRNKKFVSIDFPSVLDVAKEYAAIKKDNSLIGDGERACMAYARFFNNVIASSNFRDIVPYCEKHDIRYIGTLDILIIAYKKCIFSEAECDAFIVAASDYNHARFPKGISKIQHYAERNLDFMEEI